MPNIGALLKQEIVRLSRREIRQEVASLKKASAAYRRDIAALKRQVATVQKESAVLVKRAAAPLGNPSAPKLNSSVRFQARGVRSLRKRLGLSAPQLARLLNVSEQSVYNWETKKTTPRKEQLAAIFALRGLGKREVMQRLEAIKPPRTKQAKARKGTTRGAKAMRR
jgi:DNA-binding XRE family transcriptional regulator